MLRINQDHLVVLLAFTGAAAAVVAQSDTAVPLWRLLAASYAAGCTAALALLKRPGQSQQPPEGGKG